MKYMTYLDIPVLEQDDWAAGMSGESWFKLDSKGGEWQAYQDPMGSAILFVGPKRDSRKLSRSQYETLFNTKPRK